MSIQIHEPDAAGFAAANATPDPKHIWHDGDRIVVYTGADIPPVPPPEPKQYAEDVVIRAIKTLAPATTDKQAIDALTAARGEAAEAEAIEGGGR